MWQTIRLGDVCTISSSKRIFAKEYQTEGIPFYRGKEVIEKHNGNKVSTELFISPKRYEEIKGKYEVPKKGDILLTSVGTLGIPWLVDEDDFYFKDGNLTWLRCNTQILPSYLYLWLNSAEAQNQIDVKCIGSTQKALTIETLNKFQITLPSLELQKKIVAVINPIESRININRSVNENLLDQMQALYKSWFVDFLPFDGVRPESWTKTDIYSLANIIYGAPFASKQFNTAGEGKPIIRIRDLKDQQFATYTTEVHPKGYLLQPGDIVVGMDGEFRPYIWGNDEAWLNQRVCVFENKRPNGKAFLYFTIKPLLFAIEQTQVATTVIHIGKKDYDAFEITLPDTTTLDNFDALTSPMIMQIVSNSFENKRLSSMRDALLPKLMSGEIDVSSIQL